MKKKIGEIQRYEPRILKNNIHIAKIRRDCKEKLGRTRFRGVGQSHFDYTTNISSSI